MDGGPAVITWGAVDATYGWMITGVSRGAGLWVWAIQALVRSQASYNRRARTRRASGRGAWARHDVDAERERGQRQRRHSRGREPQRVGGERACSRSYPLAPPTLATGVAWNWVNTGVHFNMAAGGVIPYIVGRNRRDQTTVSSTTPGAITINSGGGVNFVWAAGSPVWSAASGTLCVAAQSTPRSFSARRCPLAMPQVTLVPWTTELPEEFGYAVGLGGHRRPRLRAVDDGNSAACAILGGGNDSNPVRGYQWRVAGTGAVFSWANKTINICTLSRCQLTPDVFERVISSLSSSRISRSHTPNNFQRRDLWHAIGVPVGTPCSAIRHTRKFMRRLLADNYLILDPFLQSFAARIRAMRAEAARVIVTYDRHDPEVVVLFAMEA